MYEEIFKYAKAKGIESLELYVSESKETSVNLFHGEIDDYRVSSEKVIYARGIYNGKMGYATSEKYDASIAKTLVKAIITNAKIVTSEDKAFIYPGDKEYKEIKVYNEELENVPMETKISLIKEVEKKALAYDERIVEVAANEYVESEDTISIINDKGLNLSQHSNSCAYYLAVVARGSDGDKDGDYIYTGNDFKVLNADEIVKKACNEALEKLGSGPVKSGLYKVVLDGKMMAMFLNYVIANVSASNIQDGMSIWKNKIGDRVAGENFTLIEDPWMEGSILSTGFDDEGVATKPKTIIDKGVLTMYLYNLKRGLKDGVNSTGNGYRSGSSVGIGVRNAYLKQGTKSKEELFKQVGDGLYITGLAGMHASMDAISGNFSLQAEGFVIRDGKKAEPVSVITVAGNLFTMINEIVELGNDADEDLSSNFVKSPSVILKGLVVAGL